MIIMKSKDVYDFMYKNIKIGDFTHELREGIDWYTFTLTNGDTPDIYLPVEFYGLYDINRNKKVEMSDILWWISSRVVPRNRQGLNLYLDLYNINTYNIWKMVKSNRGATLTDYFWLSDGTTTYEQFHPRYKMEHNIPINWTNPYNITSIDGNDYNK